MWKHKNFINLQLCAPPPTRIIDISLNGSTVSINVGTFVTWKENYLELKDWNILSYTCTATNVVWNDGTILQYNGVDVLPTDNIISNGQYTTRAAAPTLTFKHFYDAGTIGTGTYKFRHYSQQEPTPPVYTDCLTFTGESSEFTLAVGANGAKEWDGTVYYSTDHNTWNVWDGAAISSANKRLYLHGKNNTKFYTSKGAQLQLSARAACTGNIQTLLDYENPPTSISSYDCYDSLFKGCANLTTAPELPATTLAIDCYTSMFQDCTSLTIAPALPATTLEQSCYNSMFEGCTNLTVAPELPATDLAIRCYSYMFKGCTNLTEVPELPATTLFASCYDNMFYNCTSLTMAPELLATNLPLRCYYAMFQSCTSLKVNTASGKKIFTCPSNMQSYAVENMFKNTGGSFTGTPTAGTAYYYTE